MQCKKELNRGMMIDKFGKVFINKEYRKHRENVLLDRERGLLPETQPFVEMHNELKKDILQKFIDNQLQKTWYIDLEKLFDF